MYRANKRTFRRAYQKLLSALSTAKARLRKPEPSEEDPFAYVTAPKKPRTPLRGAAAVAELPDE